MKAQFLILIALLAIVGVAAQTGSGPLSPPLKSNVPMVRTVTINPQSVQVYTDAQKRTEEMRKVVEASSVWKDYVIAQNQEQSALLYVLAENGIKPSDGCKPMTKDGKVLTVGGLLDHFDCEVKAAPKGDSK